MTIASVLPSELSINNLNIPVSPTDGTFIENNHNVNLNHESSDDDDDDNIIAGNKSMDLNISGTSSIGGYNTDDDDINILNDISTTKV